MTGPSSQELANFTNSLRRFGAAAGRVRESMHKVGAAVTRFAAQLTIPVPPHAFTPDYDLNCRRCPRSAEEH